MWCVLDAEDVDRGTTLVHSGQKFGWVHTADGGTSWHTVAGTELSGHPKVAAAPDSTLHFKSDCKPPPGSQPITAVNLRI